MNTTPRPPITEGAIVRVRTRSVLGTTSEWTGTVISVDEPNITVRDDRDGSVEEVPISRVEVISDGLAREQS